MADTARDVPSLGAERAKPRSVLLSASPPRSGSAPSARGAAVLLASLAPAPAAPLGGGRTGLRFPSTASERTMFDTVSDRCSGYEEGMRPWVCSSTMSS